MGSSRFGQFGILIQEAWISLKIFGIIELSRVDQDGHNHQIASFRRMFDQTKVTLVECAHCRHKSTVQVEPIRLLLPILKVFQ